MMTQDTIEKACFCRYTSRAVGSIQKVIIQMMIDKHTHFLEQHEVNNILDLRRKLWGWIGPRVGGCASGRFGCLVVAVAGYGLKWYITMKLVLDTDRERSVLDRIYFAKGDFRGMNGNYASGVLEGLNRFGLYN
jgi:hypothetical protein